jgi:hypothetical protein
MSIKFEGEVLEEIRNLKARVLLLERTIDELKVKPPVVDEVNEWLSKRNKSKYG